METYEDFIKYSLQKVYFYIESSFWSKLDNNILHTWLNNFESLDERYCAAKLLDRFVYYSEKDTIRLLDFGLNEIILKRYICKEEISSKFQLSNKDIIRIKNVFYEKCAFLPLTSMSNTNVSESSYAIARCLTNDININEDKILDNNNLSSENLKKINNIIIFDDFIGTGNQILNYWNYGKLTLDGKSISPKELKNKFPDIEIEYFCLVCTEEGLDNFYSENLNVGLKITFCEKLSSKYKVFGSSSVYFDNDEVEKCKKTLENLCAKRNIDLLGYNGHDYAIAFHHSMPDTSLPLFYKEEEFWNPLFKNKKTKKDGYI
ncbi:phosphoribosyltransferase-like protein [Myroides odoratimimus]|uniref:phosphoribosyltransferase-like protein n=1 Tax=Myroides odoratimimus TaxID=76832 RepID=UPI002DB6F038|nr:hypothetical protein [Myroides odoratimimus]MEC4084643.1 hypothetical protein [Myroides odoratimimus]